MPKLIPITAYLLPDGRIVRSEEEGELALLRGYLSAIIGPRPDTETLIDRLLQSPNFAITLLKD